jgi:cytochrome P450
VSSTERHQLREQEPLLQSHITNLVTCLHEHAETGQAADMTRYFEFTTSDIIGSFCFARSFDQLKSGAQYNFFKVFTKAIPVMVTIREFGNYLSLPQEWLRVLRRVLSKFRNGPVDNIPWAEDLIKKRIDMGAEHKDMMTHVIGHISENDDGISIAELARTSIVLLLAGAETTATTLSGAMFYLLKNPAVLESLTQEIRTTFHSDEEVNIIKASSIVLVFLLLPFNR